MLSMGLVLTTSNGLHFLIAWELFAVCGYFLDHARSTAPRGARGGLAVSRGVARGDDVASSPSSRCWRRGPGAGNSARCAGTAELAPLFWLLLFGFGVKAGLFPLHVWLPSAHANAPSHVSAIISGVAIKMGIYGIMRFSGWLPVPPAAGWVVIAIGASSALLGIVFAFAQNDVKRLLAYCSVENIGVILVGVGAALLVADARRRAMGAAWHWPARCCTCGITASSSHCCSSAQARCCTPRGRAK